MSWTTADIPDLSGRTAVVTGANGGLGLATARALAGAGAHVVMAVRDQAKAHAAHERLLRAMPQASLELVELDLASLASVSAAAATILAAHPKVDILVNNAGLMALPERRTADGFEMQDGVNHLGHWALTAHLLPAILAAAPGRVVALSSAAHLIARRSVGRRDGEPYRPWQAYARSKLANLHFAVGLQREFARYGAPAASLAAHPGLTHSDLQARSARERGGLLPQGFLALTVRVGMPPAVGALSQLRAATDPAARGGQFYGPRWISSGPPTRRPLLRRWDLDANIRELWAASESRTGVTLDVAKALTQASRRRG